MSYSLHYEEVKNKLNNLLQERKNSINNDERSVQEFFENHPFSLLGALDGIDSNYNVFGSVIITQPKLRSYDGDRSPDFLIVTWNSLNLYFNFIEIEDPRKKIFAGTSQIPTSDFTQAYNQIMQWSSFKKNEVESYCAELLKSLFKENFNNTPEKLIHYNYILVYGFSDEITQLGDRHNHILQEYFTPTEKHHVTYSRLLANIRFEQGLFTVKRDAELNKFKAIAFSPFTTYKTFDWSNLHNVVGKQELIRNSNLLSEEEKDSIIASMDYLDSKSLQEIQAIGAADMGTFLLKDFKL